MRTRHIRSPRLRVGLILAAGLAFACPLAAQAQIRARCDIGNANGENYQGPCIFTLGPKGSFSVVRFGNAPIIEDAIEIQIRVTAPLIAEAHSLTAIGTDERWGRARRSKACWRGTDFWICVYALNARPVPGGNSPLATPGTTAPSRR